MSQSGGGGGREGEGRKGRRGAYFMHTPGLFSLSPSNPVNVSGNKNNSSTLISTTRTLFTQMQTKKGDLLHSLKQMK